MSRLTQAPQLSNLKQKPKKYWMGSTPDKCDICHTPLTTVFIDGRTRLGYWAIMCPTCHRHHGSGLGTGCGQKYDYSTLEKLEG